MPRTSHPGDRGGSGQHGPQHVPASRGAPRGRPAPRRDPPRPGQLLVRAWSSADARHRPHQAPTRIDGPLAGIRDTHRPRVAGSFGGPGCARPMPPRTTPCACTGRGWGPPVRAARDGPAGRRHPARWPWHPPRWHPGSPSSGPGASCPAAPAGATPGRPSRPSNACRPGGTATGHRPAGPRARRRAAAPGRRPAAGAMPRDSPAPAASRCPGRPHAPRAAPRRRPAALRCHPDGRRCRPAPPPVRAAWWSWPHRPRRLSSVVPCGSGRRITWIDGWYSSVTVAPRASMAASYPTSASSSGSTNSSRAPAAPSALGQDPDVGRQVRARCRRRVPDRVARSRCCPPTAAGAAARRARRRRH